MVEKGIRCGICHAIHRYAEANNKYMKNYDKNKESLFIKYLDTNNLYLWEMSQKLPVDGFKWKKNVLKFNEDFVKSYDEDSIKDIYLKYMLNILKIYMICIVIYHSFQKEWKLINAVSLDAVCMK